uniref:Uncharacterized protein n=1 Tax=Cacopsylla melanoneura TaxID=428564 RepID=A0A8D9F621_9HEMI
MLLVNYSDIFNYLINKKCIKKIRIIPENLRVYRPKKDVIQGRCTCFSQYDITRITSNLFISSLLPGKYLSLKDNKSSFLWLVFSSHRFFYGTILYFVGNDHMAL